MSIPAPATDFWSRRKAQVRAAERAATSTKDTGTGSVDAPCGSTAPAPCPSPHTRENRQIETSDDEILGALGLADPDTLSAGDDFKAYLSSAVPAHIRNRALRRLWRLDPVLANVDGLVDYGEDFTSAATVVGDLQTAYQVGKGMTRHVLEQTRQAAEHENVQEQQEPARGEDTLDVDRSGTQSCKTPCTETNTNEGTDGELAAALPALSASPAGKAEAVLLDESPAPGAYLSRMQFSFDDVAEGDSVSIRT